MARYQIISGAFRLPDDSLLGLGDMIDLPDDVAQRFSDQLVSAPVTPEPTAPVVATAEAE